eukprot:4085917-Karenia_brevis.AAC.1
MNASATGTGGVSGGPPSTPMSISSWAGSPVILNLVHSLMSVGDMSEVGEPTDACEDDKDEGCKSSGDTQAEDGCKL